MNNEKRRLKQDSFLRGREIMKGIRDQEYSTVLQHYADKLGVETSVQETRTFGEFCDKFNELTKAGTASENEVYDLLVGEKPERNLGKDAPWNHSMVEQAARKANIDTENYSDKVKMHQVLEHLTEEDEKVQTLTPEKEVDYREWIGGRNSAEDERITTYVEWIDENTEAIAEEYQDFDGQKNNTETEEPEPVMVKNDD